MSRPSFESIYMRLALSLAERSTCRRLQVGCVITSSDYRSVYAVGYNGSAAGGPNDCDRHGEEGVGNCGCIHAEQNAVINCTVSRGAQKVVFCTNLPCVHCAKFLINMGGVSHVYYAKDYRLHDALDWLKNAGIPYTHWTDS